MKTLIIYKSYSKMNTEKIAKAMAEVMAADFKNVESIMPEDLENYDLIGFGSGIYGSKFHKNMYKFIEKMPTTKKNVFIFCTSGSGDFTEKGIREKLSEKGCKIIGEFSCPGVFNLLGINLTKKGHPDEKDIECARMFAKGLLKL